MAGVAKTTLETFAPLLDRVKLPTPTTLEDAQIRISDLGTAQKFSKRTIELAKQEILDHEKALEAYGQESKRLFGIAARISNGETIDPAVEDAPPPETAAPKTK